MATAPIKRIELEFLPSNISGYDSIIQINIIKEPGYIGAIKLLNLDKFIVGEENTDSITNQSHLLTYIGNGVYMANEVFIGGVDIASIAKDKANVEIQEMNLKDLRYFLDVSISSTDLLVFRLAYEHNSLQYTTPVVMSYKPLITQPLYKGFIRPCVTIHNHRHRGPNESHKYDQFNQEIYDDLRYLNGIKTEMIENIQTNVESMDSTTTALYNIRDQVAYYQKYILGA